LNNMLISFRDLFAPPRHLILLVAAAWIGLALAEKRAARHGIDGEQLNNLTFYSIIGFLVGGRILFVLQNMAAFTNNPRDLISINPHLFDLSGALAVAFVVALIYAQRHDLFAWAVLDALVPFFAILSIGLGLSHLAAGTAFGLPTSIPWAIDLWNDKRHPTQVYEILASFLIFMLLWRKRPNPHPGIDFLIFAALTAASRLFLSAFRGDSTLVLNGLHREQVMAWAALAVCFVLFEFRLKPPKETTLNKTKPARTKLRAG
jgi:phosphatidylglycerol---prolipoprotein diacylglyceryl transferase